MPQTTQSDGTIAPSTLSGQSKDEPVTLPPNVSIYNGTSSEQLLKAKLFTRLETTVQDPDKLTAALGSDCAAFCIQHLNVAVIFDDDQDSHHEHFRQVCLKLKEHDLGLQFASCVFDAGSALQAGFQLDKLSQNSVLVIDLQNQEEGDDDDDDGEDGGLGAFCEVVGGSQVSDSIQRDGK